MRVKVLSPQEERIEKNKGKVVFFKDPDEREKNRIEKIFESFENSKSSVDVQRARYLTESFKSTEGQTLSLRWAKALYHIAEIIDIIIDDNQLLAGRVGKSGKYGLIYPELDGCFLKSFAKQAKSRVESPFEISDEDVKIIEEEIAPYWEGKTYYEDLAQSLPKDVLKLTYEPEDLFTSRYIVNETSSMRSALQWVHDYNLDVNSDVEIVNIAAGDASTVLSTGEVDAVAIWEPNVSRLVADGTAKIIGTGNDCGLLGVNPLVVRKEFAENNADILQVIIEQYARGVQALSNLEVLQRQLFQRTSALTKACFLTLLQSMIIQ